MRNGFLLALVLPVAACGGSSDNEPLLAGSVTGTYETAPFTVKNGVFGKVTNSSGTGNVLALSNDDFGCSTLSSPSPPKGYFVSVVLPSLDVGVHSGLLVQLYENHGSLNGAGSNSGAVEIVALTDASLAGNISYSDTVNGKSYAVNGDFEVTHCP